MVDSFWKALARKLKSLFISADKFFGQKENFTPLKEYVEWIESLKQNNASTGPVVESGVVEAHNASLAAVEDQRNVGPTEDLQVAPQDASLAVTKVLDKMLLTPAQRRKISALLDHHNFIVKWGWTILQLAQKNRHVQPLQDYVDLGDQWYNLRMKWISRTDGRLREIRKAGKNQGAILWEFMFELDSMSYLSKQERDAKVVRWPTNEELSAIGKKLGLNDLGMELYEKIKKDFNDFIDAVQEVQIEAMSRELASTAVKQEIIDIESAKIKKQMDELRRRPYFPHIRFGDFSAVVSKVTTKMVDGKEVILKRETVFLEQFKFLHTARKAALIISKRVNNTFGPLGPNESYRVGVDAVPQEVMPLRGLPPSLLRSLEEKLKLSDVQKEWLDKFIVEQGPARSFRKRLLKRGNIPGFSYDGMRSYANYFFHGAGYLARRKYGDPMQQAVNEAAREGSELRDKLADDPNNEGLISDVSKRRGIIDFMQDHLTSIMDPKPDGSMARAIAFTWWIGAVPSSAVLNLTQIPMVAMPYLGARFGDLKTVKAFGEAAKDIKKLYADPKNVKFLDDIFVKGLGLAMEEGFIDESMATEVGATAEGRNMAAALPGNAAHKALMIASHASSWMFATSEKFNRRLVFRAAWGLALKEPNKAYIQELIEKEHLSFERLINPEGHNFTREQAGAWLAGRDAVRRTQYEYAKWSRPRFMRGRLQGALFTFFMFPQNTVWFMFNSPGNIRFLVMMAILGGMQGIPFSEDVQALIRFLSRHLFGKDWDVEKEARKFVIELSESPDLADNLMHGISRNGFGLPAMADAIGIPFPSFDM
ncbi:MAG: PLxRFG domain-containing protein, partial [Deltaproteobacteria bacterium]|nr:PLxRFG domain-containing protein [Deltaproteobacteria bacterium]